MLKIRTLGKPISLCNFLGAISLIASLWTHVRVYHLRLQKCNPWTGSVFRQIPVVYICRSLYPWDLGPWLLRLRVLTLLGDAIVYSYTVMGREKPWDGSNSGPKKLPFVLRESTNLQEILEQLVICWSINSQFPKEFGNSSLNIWLACRTRINVLKYPIIISSHQNPFNISQPIAPILILILFSRLDLSLPSDVLRFPAETNFSCLCVLHYPLSSSCVCLIIFNRLLNRQMQFIDHDACQTALIASNEGDTIYRPCIDGRKFVKWNTENFIWF